MAERNFNTLLQHAWKDGKYISVGLDTNYDLIPEHLKTGNVDDDLFSFNKAIIDATKDLVCAYKPNSAYFEAHGVEGVAALKKTCDYILAEAPNVVIILDAKRADIGITNSAYAQYAFEYLHADAITVHPYLGKEALEPFLAYSDKGIIVLCHTSNPGAGEFQELEIHGQPLFEIVAQRVSEEWNMNGNCALVVGATYTEAIARVRAVAPTLPFLIPGIGAQGGDLEATVTAARTAEGGGMIINSSRGIIFASSGDDFAKAARTETQKLHDQITQHLSH